MKIPAGPAKPATFLLCSTDISSLKSPIQTYFLIDLEQNQYLAQDKHGSV